jgi:putative aldouronate transport system permease protein
MKKKRKPGDIVFDCVNILLMLLVIAVTFYPFWYAVVGSFNEGQDYMRGGVYFWPRAWTLKNFKAALINSQIFNAFKVTLARTALATIGHIFVTSLFSYALTRKKLKLKGLYKTLGLITLFFSGGLIPYYLLINWTGLYNTFWVYIFPGLFSFYHAIIFMSFYKQIPEMLIESASIDGAREYGIYIKIILPLSKPVLATISLFVAVANWNSFFDSMMFTSSVSLQTVQLYLMKIIKFQNASSVLANQIQSSMGAEYKKTTSVSIQMATMVVATAPIIVLYPFAQKFFIKGMMIGSIKG